MLVLSPTEGMTTYDPAGTYVFRSEVPAGYKVIPRRTVTKVSTISSSGGMDTATTTTTTTSTYEVPMLGMTRYKDKTSEVKLKFGGDMKDLDAKAYLKNVGGKTHIKMKFDDMQKLPTNKRFVLWTSGPNGYTKIGQVIHAGKKDTAEIQGDTDLSDFGLFMTVEDTDVMMPTSTVYSTFTFVPAQ
jgi:hypothetical protein